MSSQFMSKNSRSDNVRRSGFYALICVKLHNFRNTLFYLLTVVLVKHLAFTVLFDNY